MFNKTIKIGRNIVGGSRTFIIAEIGSNHNQSIDTAFRLMDVAKKSGADAVKFQSIKPEQLYDVCEVENSFLELLSKIELKESWYKQIDEYAKSIDLLWFSAPTYLDAVNLLCENNVELMKIASPQTYGFPQLIQAVGSTNLPTIMSTGYCDESDIDKAVKVFEATNNKNLILLHCVAKYPTLPCEAQLNRINKSKESFNCIIGFSDHTLGSDVTVAAVAAGAKVIEKHLTLSRELDGPDHFFALEPDEFEKMVNQIRDTERVLGSLSRELTNFEFEFRDTIVTKVFAKEDILQGENISSNKIGFKRCEIQDAITSWDYYQSSEFVEKKKIIKGEFITENCVGRS